MEAWRVVSPGPIDNRSPKTGRMFFSDTNTGAFFSEFRWET